MASSAALRVLQSRSFVVAGALVTPAATALCEKKDYLPKGKDGSVDWSAAVTQLSEGEFWDKVGQDLGGKVQSSIETGVPTQLSYGFVSGYCSGLALKTVGKAAATIFGTNLSTRDVVDNSKAPPITTTLSDSHSFAQASVSSHFRLFRTRDTSTSITCRSETTSWTSST